MPCEICHPEDGACSVYGPHGLFRDNKIEVWLAIFSGSCTATEVRDRTGLTDHAVRREIDKMLVAGVVVNAGTDPQSPGRGRWKLVVPNERHACFQQYVSLIGRLHLCDRVAA